MANDAVDPARDQPVPGLDGNQPAEPVAEHEDRPESQRTTGGEQNDAEPANAIPVEDPEPLAVGIGRQIGGQHPDQTKGRDDPSVGSILALAGAEIAAAEERDAGQHEEGARKRNQRRVGEEAGKPAPAEDREPEIGEGRDHCEKGKLEGGRHPSLPSGERGYGSDVSKAGPRADRPGCQTHGPRQLSEARKRFGAYCTAVARPVRAAIAGRGNSTRAERRTPAGRMIATHCARLHRGLSSAQCDDRGAPDAQSIWDHSAVQHFRRGHQRLPGGLGMIAESSRDIHRIAEIRDLPLGIAALADDDRPGMNAGAEPWRNPKSRV